MPVKDRFQSTLPVWGATSDGCQVVPVPCDFNPRSPCGERPGTSEPVHNFVDISIHAPRVGSDQHRCCVPGCRFDFNPRSPCGERLTSLNVMTPIFLFQSTLPVWGATQSFKLAFAACRISIHAPRVGSDSRFPLSSEIQPISIHAPRVGSDIPSLAGTSTLENFNPRSPCGERL